METNLQELWKEHITAYQVSGQSMKAWCKEHDLTVQIKISQNNIFGDRLTIITTVLILNLFIIQRCI